MRYAPLLAAGLTWLVLGATCVPLTDNTQRTTKPGNTLTIVLKEPTKETSVPQGRVVTISWVAANLTGEPATVSLLVESRTDLSRATLISGIELRGSGGSGEYLWDTQEFAGAYSVIARIQTPSASDEDASKGLVTIVAAPTFVFTSPASDVEFEPNAAPTRPVNIAWKLSGKKGTVRIGLDPDQEHGGANAPAEETRNEITLYEIDLSTATESGSRSWEGKGEDGKPVSPKTYYLFAIASDGVNPDVTAEATGRITVKPSPAQLAELAITRPTSDQVFLRDPNDPNSVLDLELDVNQAADVLIDLKIDTDDNHQNGNEVTILAQRLVEKNKGKVPYAWNGKDAGDNVVPDGIYRLFALSSSGTTTPKTAEASGLIFRRSTKDQPLIALLEPATILTIDYGDYLTVRWRDDDPNDPNHTTTVRVVLDDDPNPAEETETGKPELEILSGRKAAEDGVWDTFNTWQVPGSLTPGVYYVFAYIDRDAAGPADHHSVAPGRLIIKDPTRP